MTPAPDIRAIIRAAENWQTERNADPRYQVTEKEAALFAATLGPFMLRPPTTERVRELLDAVGDQMDLASMDPVHPSVRTKLRLAECRAINAAWRVGGEMP